jgi:hypothetical protein
LTHRVSLIRTPAARMSCRRLLVARARRGFDAARVHVAGALDIATGAQLEREPTFDDRVLRLSGALVVAVLIAAAIVDESDAGGYGAPQAWLCATVLAIGCIVSRGPAKSCSRDPYTEDG